MTISCRFAAVGAFTMLAAATASGQSVSAFREDPAAVERAVIVALNEVRTNPVRYAETLRAYRAGFHGKIVSDAGSESDVETVEGVAPVDDAIAFLGHQAPLGTIAAGTTLRQAAHDHASEQAASGRTGHFSPRGWGPAERNATHGGGRNVSEVIAYGGADAAEVVRELIVDDGVSDRGHRKILFERHLKFAGVACGPHPTFGTMCVIDLADTPDGRG
jgi:uncharacterized protein YkwD